MADVKWSDNTAFPPQVSITNTDYIMGLTHTVANAKYPASLFALQNGAATFSQLNIPNTTPTWVFVGTGGSNTNNGQIIQALRDVIFADANATSGQTVIVSPGSYTGGQFLKSAFVDLFGSAKENTTFTSSSLLGINNTQWIAATAPYFKIASITLNGTASSYHSSAFVANSTQIFDNVNIVPNFVGGAMTTLSFINNFEISAPYIKDVITLTIDEGVINGDSEFESSADYPSVPTNNIFINNVAFGGAILFQTGLTGSGNFNITITNCTGITSITYDTNSASISSTLNIDAGSYPSGGIIDDTSGLLTVNYVTNVSNGISTSNGFALNNNSLSIFSWTGLNSSFSGNTYTFMAGEGAHVTNGSHNILLGNYSTSSFSGCFVWSDNTATSLANYFPSAANQFVVWPSGGFGISTATSGAAQGPQAGFHYGNNNGNDGNFLFSAKGAVTTSNMHNSELNPYISGDQLIIQQKGSTGTISNYTFPSGGATIPSNSTVVHTTGNENIGGVKTFTSPTVLLEVQNPLIYNRTASTPTAGSISSANMAGGMVVFTDATDSSWTLDTGSNLDSIFGAINSNRGLVIVFQNQTDFTKTISGNTGMSLNGMTVVGQFIIAARTSISATLIRIGSASYNLFAPSYSNLRTQVAVSGTTKTFGLGDVGTMQNCTNASTQTLTIPANGTTAFPLGTIINVSQLGAGQVVFAAAGGVTITSIVGASPKISAQYGIASCEQTSTNNWLIYGAITS